MSTCDIDACERIAHQWAGDHHVCLMHKKRWMRHGHFELVRVITPPRASRGTCVIDGCPKIDDGPHGLCKMHKTRLDRHGSPEVVIAPHERAVQKGVAHHQWTGTEATYAGIHQRLKKARGRASTYSCVDCGKRAKQWSYDHIDPDERTSKLGPYSVDVDHYDPRCVPCHKRFDLAYLGKAA